MQVHVKLIKYRQTSKRNADVKAVICKSHVFSLWIASRLSWILISSCKMTASACNSPSTRTISLRARFDVRDREDAQSRDAQGWPFIPTQLARAVRQIKHRHTGSAGVGISPQAFLAQRAAGNHQAGCDLLGFLTRSNLNLAVSVYMTKPYTSKSTSPECCNYSRINCLYTSDIWSVYLSPSVAASDRLYICIQAFLWEDRCLL